MDLELVFVAHATKCPTYESDRYTLNGNVISVCDLLLILLIEKYINYWCAIWSGDDRADHQWVWRSHVFKLSLFSAGWLSILLNNNESEHPVNVWYWLIIYSILTTYYTYALQKLTGINSSHCRHTLFKSEWITQYFFLVLISRQVYVKCTYKWCICKTRRFFNFNVEEVLRTFYVSDMKLREERKVIAYVIFHVINV